MTSTFPQRHRRGQGHATLLQPGQPETKRFQRPGRGTDGAVRSFEQSLQSRDVVGVGVGDEDGGQIRRGQAQPSRDLVMRRQEMPASTSRWVVPQENSSAFPEEPLARVCRVVKEKPHSNRIESKKRTSAREMPTNVAIPQADAKRLNRCIRETGDPPSDLGWPGRFAKCCTWQNNTTEILPQKGNSRRRRGCSADMSFQLLVFSRLFHHTDVSAQCPQLADDVFVAPLDILHAADLAFALSGQCGNDQRGTGP